MWRKKSSTARTLFFKLSLLSGFVIRGIYTGNHSMHNDGTTGATAVRKNVHWMIACVNIAYDKARQRWWFTKQSADRRWFISPFETTKEMPLIASIVWQIQSHPIFYVYWTTLLSLK
jgi:hypothetical protein